MNARFAVPTPKNEPVLNYAPQSLERAALKARLTELKSRKADIPLYIGSKELRTGKTGECRPPHERGFLLGRYHEGGAREALAAARAALAARAEWAQTPFEQRAAIFLRAAELLAGEFRQTLNAATMLAQSKNAYQAEIDAACELIDFLRFNVHFAEQIYAEQPISPAGAWNRMEHRALEGFVFAVTPFNFTSIAGNLPSAPAVMGNTVVWKPAAAAVYTASFIMELFKKAGLPDGVINMVSGPAAEISAALLASPDLAGVHFTGSTAVFQGMWSEVGANIRRYKTYPRLVGETGGKDFVVAHASADPEALAVALLRGAFEYQGQKCSAASRAYVPDSLWPKVKKLLREMAAEITLGSPEDFSHFMNAVIDEKAFEKIKGYIARAKKNPRCRLVSGGRSRDEEGFFIEPTIFETADPQAESMVEEIFGPVLTVHPYPEKKFAQTLALCEKTSPYALTGAVFAQDRRAAALAEKVLQNAAGNFYINDKPTG
ncbi:MAG: L-glutamate gamma-semialdehyde dehydrogenase, partial [Elusimicrobia bacterium]|nr:L-glutamate gamma-semialdehyde dehydrogenase [Elusimicrobiota bacterium]